MRYVEFQYNLIICVCATLFRLLLSIDRLQGRWASSISYYPRLVHNRVKNHLFATLFLFSVRAILVDCCLVVQVVLFVHIRAVSRCADCAQVWTVLDAVFLWNEPNMGL